MTFNLVKGGVNFTVFPDDEYHRWFTVNLPFKPDRQLGYINVWLELKIKIWFLRPVIKLKFAIKITT